MTLKNILIIKKLRPIDSSLIRVIMLTNLSYLYKYEINNTNSQNRKKSFGF